MVSVSGNLYSVPDGTRTRAVEVQVLAQEIRILEAGRLIAVHPVLAGRGGRSLLPGHRSAVQSRASRASRGGQGFRPGTAVQQRPLEVYDRVAEALAGQVFSGRSS